MFDEELRRFAEVCPRVAGLHLVITPRHFLPEPRPRDLAWYDVDERVVCFVRSALDRSPACLRGVIRHELGHAADERVLEDGSEKRADQIAQRVTGSPILYTKEGVQHATHGRPGRPAWLHQ